jgi:hypothetical protein
MNQHKTVQEVTNLYNAGRIYDGMRLCRRYITEKGTCIQINHLLAAGYYATQQYAKAWYIIKDNPKSELKERICDIMYKELM